MNIKLPWSMEQTIENMRTLRMGLQVMVREKNVDGKGEEDAKEIAFDFDRAIEALERQKPIKASEMRRASRNGVADCLECGTNIKRCHSYCPGCGREILWEE